MDAAWGMRLGLSATNQKRHPAGRAPQTQPHRMVVPTLAAYTASPSGDHRKDTASAGASGSPIPGPLEKAKLSTHSKPVCVSITTMPCTLATASSRVSSLKLKDSSRSGTSSDSSAPSRREAKANQLGLPLMRKALLTSPNSSQRCKLYSSCPNTSWVLTTTTCPSEKPIAILPSPYQVCVMGAPYTSWKTSSTGSEYFATPLLAFGFLSSTWSMSRRSSVSRPSSALIVFSSRVPCGAPPS
mmetsp:Transcript_6763/g.26153  ORF Transcript_6763/g.26153 Transcript_6763/m.26153 type:complete len:242 (-) Transcript_6763:794-1519(-)